MRNDIYFPGLTLVPSKTKDFLARCASANGLHYDYEAKGVNLARTSRAPDFSSLALLNSRDYTGLQTRGGFGGAYITVINATQGDVRLASAVDYLNLASKGADALIPPQVRWDDKADGSRFNTSGSKINAAKHLPISDKIGGIDAPVPGHTVIDGEDYYGVGTWTFTTTDQNLYQAGGAMMFVCDDPLADWMPYALLNCEDGQDDFSAGFGGYGRQLPRSKMASDFTGLIAKPNVTGANHFAMTWSGSMTSDKTTKQHIKYECRAERYIHDDQTPVCMTVYLQTVDRP